jgi:hypothetical protein
MTEIEIFTPTGVLAGVTERAPLTRGGSDLLAALTVARGRWYPIDGSPPSHRGEDCVAPDDILIVASPVPELKVHMAWFAVTLEAGPYRVTGKLGTHPGFDPAKAIHRPTNGFVALHEARIELPAQPAAGVAERGFVHVNRYAVDAVESVLMLGFFFPGARFVNQEPISVA